MRICSIASGSSGNCIYVGSDNTHLLIDAGVSGKRTLEGLNSLGLSLADIDGILLTHEHADHISGLGVLLRKKEMPVYTAKETAAEVLKLKSMGKLPPDIFVEERPDYDFTVGDLLIHPFSTSHDAANPMGFRISDGRRNLAVATDLGCYNEYIVGNLEGLDTLLVESNHDVRMLEVGRYPWNLKQRILSEKGHLSNESAGQLLCRVLHDNMRHIILGHLSQENNYPSLAFETVASEITMGENPYRAGDFDIQVALRDKTGDIIEW